MNKQSEILNSNDSFEKYRAEIRQFKEKVGRSKEESLKFLINAGICTPTGRLKKAYR